MEKSMSEYKTGYREGFSDGFESGRKSVMNLNTTPKSQPYSYTNGRHTSWGWKNDVASGGHVHALTTTQIGYLSPININPVKPLTEEQIREYKKSVLGYTGC